MELYHIVNRGVDRRTLVQDDQDRGRFVADLYAMNDNGTVGHQNYFFAQAVRKAIPYRIERVGTPLVQIHAWCLMGNHYHLLLSEETEGGIPKYMHKLNMSYSKYFNERHERSGPLFQGTRKVTVETDAHFLWISHYIHFNPLDFHKSSSKWREQCLQNVSGALTWLTNYRWSSYRDYLDEPGFAEIVQGSFLYENRDELVRESKRYLLSLSPDLLTKYSLD